MAISFASTASAINASTNYVYRIPSSSSMPSFHLSRKSKLQFFTKGSNNYSRMLLPIVKAEPNDDISLIEWNLLGDLLSSLLFYFWNKVFSPYFTSKVAVIDDDSSATITKSEVATTIVTLEDTKPSNEQQSYQVLATTDEESMSQFFAQVASLVKLVDSRNIVELELKHLEYEVTIRKKDGIPQAQAHGEIGMIDSHSTPSPKIVEPITQESTSTNSTLTLSTSSTSSSEYLSAKPSSHIPIKCPMAGTFYRSPEPGEPPFVNVGDKVKKGQVLCIIEAMKLMNEIEIDESGTIADILIEDAKSVSIDTPLFVIET